MDYENNVKELERIIKALSNEKLGVTEGLALYEKGIALASECLKSLNEIKGKMEILNNRLEQLEVQTEAEEDDDDDE